MKLCGGGEFGWGWAGLGLVWYWGWGWFRVIKETNVCFDFWIGFVERKCNWISFNVFEAQLPIRMDIPCAISLGVLIYYIIIHTHNMETTYLLGLLALLALFLFSISLWLYSKPD